MFAPGLSDFDKTGDTTAGVQVGKQTTIKLTVTKNADWFSSTNKTIRVALQLGHFALKGGNACNVTLISTVTSILSAGSTTYEMQLSSVKHQSGGEDCGLANLVPATELATYPIVKVKVEGDNGGNTSVLESPEPNPTYRSTLTLTAGTTVQ